MTIILRRTLSFGAESR